MNAATLLLTVLKGGGVTVANTVAPSHNATASAVIGTLITGTAGTWSGSPTLTYQWYRNAAASTVGGSAIGGATSLNRTPVDADFGYYLYFAEIPDGDTGAQVFSNVSARVVADMRTNLVSWWSLNEASGTRNDSHGTNHLTDVNTVTQAAGKVGNAGQFTAANSEWLTINDNASISTGDIDFTWSVWVYLDNTGVARGVLGKYGGGGAQTIEYELRILNTDIVRFFVANGTTSLSIQATTHGALSASTWYQIVAWHDATANTLNIQINNGAVNSVSYSDGGQNTTHALQIGASASSVPHNGRIDEVGFWKRTLTAGEKTILYNGGAGVSYTQIAGGA